MSFIHRVLRKPFFGRFEVPWNWPADVDASQWERLTFTNSRGARLAGAWGPAYEEAIGTLVLAHPMGKAAKGFWLRYRHTDLFRRSRFNVFLFDANGFGESEAVSFDYPDDILAAGLYAQQRTPNLPVGLVGTSFGAGWGLCSMARPRSPFRCAVLEGAFPTLPEFWRHYPAAYTALRLSQVVAPSFEARMRPEVEAARVVGQPAVLFIYGDNDKYTPPEHGRRLLAAIRPVATADFLVIPNIEHTYAYRDAPDTYAGRVIPFLTQALS